MATHRVIWEMTYDSATPEEAVRLAIADLYRVAITHTEGPAFFEVMDMATNDVSFIDAADAMLPKFGSPG